MATKMKKSTTGAKTAGPSKQYLKKGGMTKKQDGGTAQTKSSRLVNKAFDLYDKAESKGFNMAYDRSANRNADADNLPTNSKKTQRIMNRGDRVYERALKARGKEKAKGVYGKGGMTKSKKK